MKVDKIKSAVGFEVKDVKALGIQSWGAENNYPQKVEEIVKASGTGISCLRIRRKFIYGQGFSDPNVSKVVVNSQGHTADYILKKICDDYGFIDSCALHINYNANYTISSFHHVPIEHIRFEALDPDTKTFNRVAVHRDWTSRLPGAKKVKKDEIDFIDLFNPDPAIIEAQVEAAGGWHKYKGQILFFSAEGDKEYSSPIYESELTNMRSEEGLDNVTGRNITSNFFPGAMIVDINNSKESKQQFEALKESFRSFIGDETLGNIFLCQVKSKEDIPQKVDLTSENYDAAFSVSQKYLPDAIGRVFNQPPILRAVDVGANFGADLISNAYKFYNTQTDSERRDVSCNVFGKIFSLWWKPGELTDSTISALVYDPQPSARDIPSDILKDLTVNERRNLIGYKDIATGSNDQQLLSEKLGVEGTQSLVGIVSNPDLNNNQKNALLTTLFGLSAEQAQNIVGV